MKVGDTRQMSPREQLRRAALRYATIKQCRDFGVAEITREHVEQAEERLCEMAIAYVGDSLLTQGGDE